MAVVLLIIAALAGIYMIAKGKISFSGHREIKKPESIYVGIALLILAILSFFLDAYIILGIFVLIIIMSFFLSHKKTEATEANGKDYSITNLAIFIIAVLAIGIFFYFYLNR